MNNLLAQPGFKGAKLAKKITGSVTQVVSRSSSKREVPAEPASQILFQLTLGTVGLRENMNRNEHLQFNGHL